MLSAKQVGDIFDRAMSRPSIDEDEPLAVHPGVYFTRVEPAVATQEVGPEPAERAQPKAETRR